MKLKKREETRRYWKARIRKSKNNKEKKYNNRLILSLHMRNKHWKEKKIDFN